MKALGTLTLLVVMMIWGGFVISTLWDWLLIPIWPSLIHLSLWQAMGLSCFTSYFTIGIAREKFEGADNAIALALVGLVQSLLIMGIAWLVSLTY